MLQILMVHDSKADAYIQPFFTPTVEVAIRSLTTAANDPATDICRYPEDYVLFHTGYFDPHKGTITLYESPKHICNIITLKEK